MKAAFLALLLATGWFGTSQSLKYADVPTCVRDSLAKHYSPNEKLKWERDTGGKYLAKFRYLGYEHAARFDLGGQWLETTASIPARLLPDRIQHWLAEFYPGYEARRIKRTEKNGQDVFYLFDVENDREVFVMKMSHDGKLIEKYRDRF